MVLKKNPKADLRGKYKLFFEFSLITSLAIIIVAFKYFPDIDTESRTFETPQELFMVEDIQQTVHESTPPPPPPKPQIIVAVPLDEILEDIEISSTDLNVSEEVAPPPPMPKADKKIFIEEEPVYFVAVEEMPEPIGGIAAIQRIIVYPEIARRAGLEGTVYILAYLNEEGLVVKTEIAKGIGGGCEESAVQAVKQTKFKPGKQRGKPVKVKVMIPIKFRLSEKPV